MDKVLGYIFTMLGGVLIGALLLWKINPIPKGKMLVDKSAMDSLNAFVLLADSIKSLPKAPIVTITDTVYVKEIKYVATKPIHENDTTKNITHFRDSLIVEDEIAVWIDAETKGNIKSFKLNWKYKPIFRTIEKTIEVPVYHPVIETITKEVSRYYTGHYLSLAAGGNAKMFTFGLDYTITNDDFIYGLEYRRYGDQNVYGFQVGINLRTIFKRNR